MVTSLDSTCLYAETELVKSDSLSITRMIPILLVPPIITKMLMDQAHTLVHRLPA